MYRCVRRKKRGFAGLANGIWGGEMESFFLCNSTNMALSCTQLNTEALCEETTSILMVRSTTSSVLLGR